MKKWDKNYKDTAKMAGTAGAGATVGAIVGAVIGGPFGFVVGGMIGAGVGGGASIALDSNDKPPKLTK